MANARDRILDVAEQILCREGIDALSTRRVATDVGLTAMAIYRHYRDKEALIDALVDRGFARWEARLADAVAAGSPLDRIEGALRAYRDFALEEPRYFELMFLRPRRGVPRAPDSLRATPSPSFAAAIAAVEEAMRAGELPPGDPAEFILPLWAMAHGLIAFHFTGRFGHDEPLFRDHFERAVATLLNRISSVPADPD